ncbi:Methylglyoxal synthase [Candidatus Desulfosporosinus infrequens]|uniref:Methylglyoxal synthase n=1 Tax=Candidatus Desulfosporosinus infrequens TaxID=2043169 RepID=A0A2U3LY03_9FIRM|nr:Methylglyoxal synthase [Candidatus Desulfosporosinus infrequens]
MFKIALVAHDEKKAEMIEFARKHQAILCQCELTATGTTGKLVKQHTGLPVTTLLSGPIGGDQQIGSLVATQRLDMIFFLRDPLTAQAHEPDISALLRVCDVHNIPLATNRKSAEILMTHVKLCLEGGDNNADCTN